MLEHHKDHYTVDKVGHPRLIRSSFATVAVFRRALASVAGDDDEEEEVEDDGARS